MTRKDFVLIAEVVRENTDPGPTRNRLALAFARQLIGTNPSFNRPRFLEECGYE